MIASEGVTGIEPGTTLRTRIDYWLERGFRVTSETQTSAQLVRPKRFDLRQLANVPLYPLLFLRERDGTVYLAVDDAGHVTERAQNTEPPRYLMVRERPGHERAKILAWIVITVIVFTVAYFAVRG